MWSVVTAFEIYRRCSSTAWAGDVGATSPPIGSAVCATCRLDYTGHGSTVRRRTADTAPYSLVTGRVLSARRHSVPITRCRTLITAPYSRDDAVLYSRRRTLVTGRALVTTP